MELHPTQCPICRTGDGARQLYPANFDPRALNPEIFSARRLPDRIHFRLVRCQACGLVRSDPVAATHLLSQLYSQSDFTYQEQTQDLCRTYGRYLDDLATCGAVKDTLLEIGCGNGFFLGEARARGYAEVRGVEPSKAAVERADPHVRSHIVCDVMRPGLFDSETFNVICLFQVFDHIPDPGALLAECFTLLKPGGLMLFIHHNVEAVSARLLGRLSPIIDIEHTYLYSLDTMTRLCRIHGFSIAKASIAFNTYSLSYLARLLPLPGAGKKALLTALDKTPLGRIRLRVPLGNLHLVARKEQP
ncbi:MAG: class I SAM-dependent methyltransferase [Candidatus Latescibacterota bacterium]|nr:class I SAM-dependent methyltransferase [Candidatus Latescibacterota bacterium]